MKEKYLPIGTVVLLKDASKHLMITGYCSSTPEDPEKFYDYVSMLFPEGALAGEGVALFDHDQIEKIFFEGFVDEEEVQFKEKLNRIVVNLEKERNSETAFEASVEAPVPSNDIAVTEVTEDYGDITPFGE